MTSSPIYIVELIEQLRKLTTPSEDFTSENADNDETPSASTPTSNIRKHEEFIALNSLFHNQLSYSLLAGEPIRYVDKYAGWLDEVTELLSKLIFSDIVTKGSEEIIASFKGLTSYIIRRLRRLVSTFEQAYQDPNLPKPEFDLDGELPIIPKEKKDLNPDFELTEAAIDLTEIDLNLTNTEEYVSKLIRLKLLFDKIREDFNKASLGTEDRERIVSLLTDKTYLFFYKLKKRLALDGISNRSYLKNGRIYNIEIDSERLPFAYLGKVHNDISLLYNQNPQAEGFEQRFKQRFEELENISQAAYQRFGIHYYKDVLQDEKELNKFAEKAISDLQPLLKSTDKYERRIAQVNTFYFHCAKLTCYLGKHKEDIRAEDLQKQLDKFISLVNELDVRNHHPFLRLACACSEYLQRLVKKRPEDIEKEYEATLTCFERSLKSLDKTFAWSSKHSFIPYQLSFKDREKVTKSSSKE